ncbi:uncharacterized protein BDR25DRAFT_308532 [Lindgomyces ingoldianus]|uniref:Uncharacterized protein n=1 Tax=Lindgomyces ingoldianus TaxID=673940 RepID=A0ACB6REE8_9PLEO|nr:uncharacterized protein BDR25DRAFT_308532 [Lindgomyces ingoldianus]KAF2477639.1 hypothetical protein BDR25DRAFT_308532 [Lindgomyces ingoldianus]
MVDIAGGVGIGTDVGIAGVVRIGPDGTEKLGRGLVGAGRLNETGIGRENGGNRMLPVGLTKEKVKPLGSEKEGNEKLPVGLGKPPLGIEKGPVGRGTPDGQTNDPVGRGKPVNPDGREKLKPPVGRGPVGRGKLKLPVGSGGLKLLPGMARLMLLGRARLRLVAGIGKSNVSRPEREILGVLETVMPGKVVASEGVNTLPLANVEGGKGRIGIVVGSVKLGSVALDEITGSKMSEFVRGNRRPEKAMQKAIVLRMSLIMFAIEMSQALNGEPLISVRIEIQVLRFEKRISELLTRKRLLYDGLHCSTSTKNPVSAEVNRRGDRGNRVTKPTGTDITHNPPVGIPRALDPCAELHAAINDAGSREGNLRIRHQNVIKFGSGLDMGKISAAVQSNEDKTRAMPTPLEALNWYIFSLTDQ